MMHNYYDRPIDITAEKEIRSLFTFGYGGEWYNLSQAILWLGNRLRNSQGDGIQAVDGKYIFYKEKGKTI